MTNWQTPIEMFGITPFVSPPPVTPFRAANEWRWRCYIPLICELKRQGKANDYISKECGNTPSIAHESTDILHQKRYFPQAADIDQLFEDARKELIARSRISTRTRRLGSRRMRLKRDVWLARQALRCRYGIRNAAPNTGKWQDWTPEMQAREFGLH